MFLATLAGRAASGERSNFLRADGRRERAGDERLDGSANGRGRSTGWADLGADGGNGRDRLDGELFELFEFSERADRVGAGLRDLDAGAVRNDLRVDGNGRERRVSVARRRELRGRRELRERRERRERRVERRNERRLRERLRRRLFDRRDLRGRRANLRRDVDDLRRNGV